MPAAYWHRRERRIADGDLRESRTTRYAGVSLTVQRQTEQAAGQAVGHTASIRTRRSQDEPDRHELLIEALGTEGLGWEGEGFDRNAGSHAPWLRSKGNSIEGGTSEINLNVIAKRVLGLKDHQ